jgi:hypothetical protein
MSLIGVHLLEACISYRRVSYRCASLTGAHFIGVHLLRRAPLRRISLISTCLAGSEVSSHMYS